jgi:hypothetical protein
MNHALSIYQFDISEENFINPLSHLMLCVDIIGVLIESAFIRLLDVD